MCEPCNNSISDDDDLVIAQLVGVEILLASADAVVVMRISSLDLVPNRAFLHVDFLAAQREDRLGVRIAPALSPSAAFHQDVSLTRGCWFLQWTSLPGRPLPSSAVLAPRGSRAFFAASRARDACMHLSTIARA